MSDWQTLTLVDVCSVITDGSHQSPKTVANGKPMASVKDLTRFGVDLSDARHIAPEDFENLAKQGCRPQVGDVLIAKDGNSALDTVCTVDKPLDAVLLSSVAILRPNPDVLDSNFLKFYLSSPDTVAYLKSNFISGAAIPRVVLRDFKRAEILLPNLEAQKRISAVLQTIDDKIDLNRRINQTLEAMAQAIFKSWFVDFAPVKARIAAIEQGQDPLRAAMRAISGKTDAELDQMPREHHDQLAATAALFPDAMEDSEMGEIPEGWNISKVETLLLRLPARTRYTKEQVSVFGQTPVFEQGASIILGYHDNLATYQASVDEPAFIFGDHTCVTKLSCQPFDISQNVIPLRGRGRATIWVYYAVKEKQKFQEYRRHWMELVSKDVVIATADICLEFSKYISSLHLRLEANERQIQGLRELRDTLLPKLISGELRIPDTERISDT